MMKNADRCTKSQLVDEIEQLRVRLDEAEQTLHAIRFGEVDALVVEGPQGVRVFSLTGAEHIYRVIAETMHEAALTVNLDGTILFCNRRFCDLMKIPLNEAVGRKVTVFVSLPQVRPLEKLLADVQAGPVQRRLTLRALDGTAVPVQVSGCLIEEDAITSICLVVSDLTEIVASAKSIRVLREQQQALEESEHRFRAIFESSQDAILIANDQGLCIQSNPAAMVIFGLSSEQMIGRHISEFMGNSLKKSEVWQVFLTSGFFKGDAQLTRADGRVLDLDCNAVANIMQGRHLFVIRDITERKRFEEELRSIADKNRLALESANMGMWSFDVHSRKTYWDQRTRLILGVESGDSERYPRTLKTIHPEDRPRVDEVLKQALDPAFSGKHAAEFRVIWRDGSIHWVSSKALTWFEGEGAKRHAVRLIGTLVDITEHEQAEEALREALSKAEEERRILKAMMDYIPMGITIAEAPDVKIRNISRFGREMTGKPRKMIEGVAVEKYAKAFDIFHSDGVTPANNEELPLTRATQKGELVREEEWVLERPDGTKIPILCTAAPIRDSKGNVTGGVIGWQDVTERKKMEEALRESELRYRTLFDSIDEGFCIIEVIFDQKLKPIDYRFIETNLSFDKHTGLLNAKGKRMRELLPLHDEHWFEIYGRIALTGEPARFQNYAEQLHRWYDVYASRFGRPGNLQVAVLFKDITKAKEDEEELRESRGTLELRVRERTAELERKNLELQEFAFIASHDLSEPLRKIQTFGSLLKERRADRLDEQSKDYISRMTTSANRMQELLHALLSYSRVDTKGPEFKPTKLDEVVRDAVTDLEAAIQNIGARVEFGGLPIVNGDPYQLRQLFQNLIANSVKYYRSEATPCIKISGEVIDGLCHISISDNGIGFDEKYLDKIFKPFQRLHGKHEYPGTGIGLAICKKIVEGHNGMITANSTPGKGSTFIVTLPTKPR